MVKAPLRRVLRKSLLALDELSTILLEIEHVVNDRPITYVAGVDEPPPLTPNMLAGSQIGRVDIQEESISHRGANRRIQYLEQLRDALTKRWEQEYITALRSHHQVKNYSFAVDDIVLLVDDKKKRQDWKLARMKCASLGLAEGRKRSLPTLLREKTTSSVFVSTCSNPVHLPSFIDLHTHATAGHVTSFACTKLHSTCSPNTSDRSLA